MNKKQEELLQIKKDIRKNFDEYQEMSLELRKEVKKSLTEVINIRN